MRFGRSVRAGNNEGRWLRRTVRGLRPDRNPLRRTSDRVETCLLAGLFAATAVGAPFAVHAASDAAYGAALRTEHAQLAARHEVRAVLTQVAGSTASDYTLSTEVPVRVSWTSVTGVKRTGEVLALAGSAKGSKVTIWTDDQGNLTSPPLQPTQVTGQGEVAELGACVGIAALFLSEAALVRYVMNRRRMAAWDADWAVTAQVWNRQSW
jgi:hypothetical protein